MKSCSIRFQATTITSTSRIYNRGTSTQPLSGWSISGVGFTFPTSPAFQLQSGAYVVVARNQATLAARYPGQLTPNVNLLGSYGDNNGTLNNSGEQIALVNATGVIIDGVTYADGGRWGHWSDGSGASLDLIDPSADNRLPSNWKDSAPPASAVWTDIEVTGIIQNGDGINLANSLELMMLDEGECLVDNVEVVPSGSANLILQGAFDGGIFQAISGDIAGFVTETNGGATNFVFSAQPMSLPPGWLAQGTHDLSDIVPGQGVDNSACLKIRATGRGDYVGNRIFYRWDPNQPLALGSTCTIRASVKWLRGHPELAFRIRGNYLEAVATMLLPTAVGTPGQANSQSVNNSPPGITEVEHFPPVPLANELVRVSARVHDPNGVASVTLKYRVGSASSYTSLAMNDAGTGGDSLAGDGLYSATIPSQSANSAVAFIVEATDGLDALNRFPVAQVIYAGDSFQRECVLRYGEATPEGSFGTYRLWMTPNTYTEWVQRIKIHNSPLDITFVYGTNRVIYNAGARYAGSIYHSPLYDTPVGRLCNYTVAFPSDDRLLGATAVNLDFDDSSPRYYLSEQLAMWMADRLRLPFNHRRFVRLYGSRCGAGHPIRRQPEAER